LVFIAGSMGPAGQLMKPYGPLEQDVVFESFAAQAQALDDAGVDLLVIETQFDINEAALAVQAVRSVSSLPLVCSFSYDRGTRTMMGVTPTQMAAGIGAMDVDMLGVNCGSSLDENLLALIELKKATGLPLWFKPNAGKPELGKDGTTHYHLDPQVMGDHAAKWIDAGAQVIGGCCGTTPAHLERISNNVKL
jgi:5-methyltetrahydrofolate--homocysteine methyltransferase